MSELHADELTAAYVRAQAADAGFSESEWLARHFHEAAMRDSAGRHAAWYAAHPGALEDEVAEAEAATAAVDAA